MRCVLKALVTVELQLCGDLFLSLSRLDCFQNKLYILSCTCFVGNNTVIKQIPNDGKIQYALLSVYI